MSVTSTRSTTSYLEPEPPAPEEGRQRGGLPLAGYAPDESACKVRIVHLLLFAFLVVLLLGLCYIIYSLLTAGAAGDVTKNNATRDVTTHTVTTDETTTPTVTRSTSPKMSTPPLPPPPPRTTDSRTTTKGGATWDVTTHTVARSTTTPTVTRSTSSKMATPPLTTPPPRTTASRRTAKSKSRPPPPGPSRPMGERPLICVFDNNAQTYDAINTDDICDYAFIPFYAQVKSDTFTDDSSPAVKALITKAGASKKTSYGIHVPFQKKTEVAKDLKSSAGQSKLQEYWTTRKIFHYAILDVSELPKGFPKSDEFKKKLEEAFDLLKAFREEQTKLKSANPGAPSPERGLIIVGMRIWPPHLDASFEGYSTAMQDSTLYLDGFVMVTHMPEYEFDRDLANLIECTITGGAPYEVLSENLAGMKKLMEMMHKQLVQYLDFPSLAMSVSLCTRFYEAGGIDRRAKASIGSSCEDINRPPSPTSEFCSGPSSIYENPAKHPKQLTGYAVKDKEIATFDTNDTISEKYCKVVKQYFADFKIGLALFDVECEDWENKCPPPSAQLSGTQRIKAVAAYHKTVASTTDANALACSIS